MKKLLTILSVITLALVCTLSVSAKKAEQKDYIFWDKEPYVESETTKIIDHVVYKLCNDFGRKEYHYDVYDWFDTQQAASTVEEINIVSEIDGIKVESVQCRSRYTDEFQYRKHEYYENHNYSVKKITIPDTITYIGPGIFSVFESVEELVVPASVKTYSFENMESLKKVTFLGDIEALGGFMDCKKLESVNLCGTVKRIGYDAFAYCKALKNFEIPETVTDMSAGAFYGTGLTSVVIPESLAVGNKDNGFMFAYCEDLKEVTFEGENLDCIRLPNRMFSHCTALETVNFPKNCRELDIGWAAFAYCPSLETFTFPEKTDKTTLDREVFLGCSSLEDVIFPETCDELTIGRWTFQRCIALRNVTLPENSKKITIYYKAFKGRSTLRTVKNSENITKIYGEAFRGCTSLKNLTLGKNLEFIGKNAFYGCKNLRTVTFEISGKTPKIYSGAFNNTGSAVKFFALSKTAAKSLKTALVKSGLKNAKVSVK